jgi:hypothetical protein
MNEMRADRPWPRRAMWVVWPGFLAACAAEFVFFAMFDPLDFNMRLHLSREAVYTFGFVAFWLLGILSSSLTLLLQRPAAANAGLARAVDAEPHDAR